VHYKFFHDEDYDDDEPKKHKHVGMQTEVDETCLLPSNQLNIQEMNRH